MEWRRICVDSRFRTSDSVSNSDFWIELPYPVQVEKGSLMYIDGVSLSNSWPTIRQGVNDILYVQETVVGSAPTNLSVVLTEGTYTAHTLQTEILTKLNAASLLPGTYSLDLNNGKYTFGNTSIAATQGTSLIFSKRLIDNTVFMKTLFGSGFTGATCTEIIGLFTNPVLADGSSFIHSTQSMTCTFVDLVRHKQIFIHAPGLGETSTMNLRGNTDIVRRGLLGGSGQGDVVTDVLSTGLSSISFSSDTTLQHIHFQVKGYDGLIIPMNNHEVSWEIVIQRPDGK